MALLWRGYCAALQRHPFKVKATTSGCTFATTDAIAQSRPFTSHAALGGDVPSALGVSSQQQESPRPGSGGAEGSPRRSHSAKPSTGQGHIIHNLPKAKSVTHKAAQKTYKTRTSQ